MIKNISSGFTMIEIVIVIVIAGIIGSMVLVYFTKDLKCMEKQIGRASLTNHVLFLEINRTTQGQQSKENFSLSTDKTLFKLIKSESFIFHSLLGDQFKLSIDGGNNYNYTKLFGLFTINGFYFYNNSYSLIIPSLGGLTNAQAKLFIAKTKSYFCEKCGYTITVIYVYPLNFRFGKQMSYHN